MAITEESRFQLHQRLETVLGKDEATTLMEHLPPVGWADVATKADIELVRRDMDREFAAVRSDLDREFAAVRSELETGLERQADAVRAQVAESLLGAERQLGLFAKSLQDMERRLGSYRTQGMAFQGVLALIIAITVVITR